MKTNYKQLKIFDIAVIGLMVFGLLIITNLFYTGLSSEHKALVSDATSILDISARVPVVRDSATLVLGVSEDFLNNFYWAFTEVAVLPDRIFTTDYGTHLENFYLGLLEYSDQIAGDFQQANSTIPRVAYSGGSIAGMSTNSERVEVQEKFAEAVQLNLPYSFQSPDLSFWNIYLGNK